MWLVLCDPRDASALWVYNGLLERGLQPLHLITSEMLAYAPRWEHRIGVGGVTTEITLGSGLRIRGEEVRGTLNRLQIVPEQHTGFARQEDRMYASSELHAFYVSWLTSLAGVMLNRPAPQGLCGYWRHASEWIRLAADAGLRTPRFAQKSRDPSVIPYGPVSLLPEGTPTEPVYIVGDYVVSVSAPDEVKHACKRLASLAGADLLSVDMGWMPDGEWTFGGATVMPELASAGYAMIEALANVLRGEEAIQ